MERFEQRLVWQRIMRGFFAEFILSEAEGLRMTWLGEGVALSPERGRVAA